VVDQLVPVDESDPAAVRPYWAEYLAFTGKARRLAPAVIRDEWILNDDAIRTQLTPVLEKYGFDPQRMEAEATDAEKAIAEQPPEDIQRAQAAIHRYESEVCAAEQPPAADNVDFSTEQRATAFCEALAADDEMSAAALAAGAKAEDMRKLATSAEFQAVIDKEHDTAPAVIKADADALYRYWKTRQLPLVAERGYDIRAILLEGPQADREVLQSTSREIRDHYARVAAYEERVCGSGS
jgi:hypothetical protein